MPNPTKKPVQPVRLNVDSFNRRRGLPPLAGTPAQVKWANDIRMSKIMSLDTAIRSAAWGGRAATLQDTKIRMCEETSAAWWIEHRNQKPFQLIGLRNNDAMQFYAALMRRA